MTTLWISLRWATFGMEVDGGIVTSAAPIARWCVGKDAKWAMRYWMERGAEVAAFCVLRLGG